MNRFRQYNILIIFLICSTFNLLCAEDNPTIEQWKYDLQILIGFTDDQVDGRMGIETFNALKKFAYNHDIEDVVLRGEFGDIEGWGFEQYLIKYHAYWLRELKNQRIFKDIHDKEYLQQADETLYTFEIAIQNAKLEVERLTHAKLREKRLAKEKDEAQKWEVEKNEAERLTAELRMSITKAELESEKWALERIRAQRLSEEKEQLARLEVRKLEAAILVSDFEDVIIVATRKINRLIEENNKIKTFITTNTDTKLLAEELKTELKVTRMQLDLLSVQKDSLDIKLHKIEALATDSVEKKLHKIEALAKDSLEKKIQKIKALSAKKPPSPTQTRNGIISWPYGNKRKEVEESSPPNEEKGEEESSHPVKKKKKKWYKRIWPFGDKEKTVKESNPTPQHRPAHNLIKQGKENNLEVEETAIEKESKLEAAILASDFEDIITVVKREIDRLIDENNKIKTFITTSMDTKILAEELQTELKATQMQLDSVNVQKDSLEQKLQEIEVLAAKKTPPTTQKEKWYNKIWPFGKK